MATFSAVINVLVLGVMDGARPKAGPKAFIPPPVNMVQACPGRGRMDRDPQMPNRNAGWTGLRFLLAVATAVAFILPACAFVEGAGPDVTVRQDRTPNKGENFTLIFTLTPDEPGNYTIQVSPRPEMAFMDTSNGSKTFSIATGTSLEYNFPMSISRTASSSSYSISYTVLKDGATIKISTYALNVGGNSACSFAILLVPLLAVGTGAAAFTRRPKV
jgi:Flp pilus assembly protein TadG